MPWDILISYLEDKIRREGVVWIGVSSCGHRNYNEPLPLSDILACNQSAIAAGNMDEIQQLPSYIEFIDQTIVMPGTLSRLWCIFGAF